MNKKSLQRLFLCVGILGQQNARFFDTPKLLKVSRESHIIQGVSTTGSLKEIAKER